MARPLWTGDLIVGALRVPVQILGAGAPETVVFHHAHRCRSAFTRIKQRKWCPHCQAEIASADVVHVYEHATGQYLEIADADLARCEVEASDALTIVGVADGPNISMLHIDTTAYLVATSEASAEPLATFCAALGATRIAIGRLVLQKREQIVWLGVAWQRCVVYLLRTVDHVSPLLRGDGSSVKVQPDHVRHLRQVLDRLPARVEHALERDEYQHRVRVMLAKKTARDSRDQLTRALRPRQRRRA